jgi:hypothetical protein
VTWIIPWPSGPYISPLNRFVAWLSLAAILENSSAVSLMPLKGANRAGQQGYFSFQPFITLSCMKAMMISEQIGWDWQVF